MRIKRELPDWLFVRLVCFFNRSCKRLKVGQVRFTSYRVHPRHVVNVDYSKGEWLEVQRVKTVEQLWDEFIHDGALFDDRREYVVADFMYMYALSLDEATRLFDLFRAYEAGQLTINDTGETDAE